MGNRNDDDGAFNDTVKNAIRETVNKTAPDLFIGKGLEFREGGNEPKGFIEFTKKVVAEPDSLFLIPGKVFRDILPSRIRKAPPRPPRVQKPPNALPPL